MNFSRKFNPALVAVVDLRLTIAEVKVRSENRPPNRQLSNKQIHQKVGYMLYQYTIPDFI